MPLRHRVAIVVTALTLTACGETAKTPQPESAPAPVVTQLPPIEVETASIKGTVTLPGAWKDAFVLSEKADTTLGATRVVEFRYPGDSAAKVPPRLLLAIRTFTTGAWAKLTPKQQAMVTKLAERDGTIYVYSIVTANPYPMTTAAGLRVEAMMLALVAGDSPFKLALK